MIIKDLENKLKVVEERANQYGKWEDEFNRRLEKGSYKSIIRYSWMTRAPLNWDNIMLIGAIASSTYKDSEEDKDKFTLDLCLKNKCIKSYSQDASCTFVTLKDGTPMKFKKITDIFSGIEEHMPQLLTKERQGRCHTNSLILGYILSENMDWQLVSGFCSLQSNNKKYPHTWIEYKGKSQWCLDSTLNVAMTKDAYYKIFDPQDVVKIDGATMHRDTELIKKSSFKDKDERLYLFFPDEARELMMEELGPTSQGSQSEM